MQQITQGDGLHFKRPDGSVLKISAEALGVMFSFRQLAPADKEAGGILLGRHIIHSLNIVVDEVSIPMRGDQRSRYGFKRSSKLHQKIIDERWSDSGGTCQYLGEWHTHPEPVPHPSSVDVGDWKRRLKHDTVDSEITFFIVVGTEGLAVSEGSRRLTQISPLN